MCLLAIVNYHNYILYLTKINQWQTGNLEDEPTAAPCTPYWKPSGQGHWKTCLIPSNRCKLIFRGLVQWSSSNRMLLCGPDIFLINATNCSIFLFICIFLFPGNYNDSVECSKSCKTEFLDLSVFLCCLKWITRPYSLCSLAVLDLSSSRIFKHQVLTFLSFWNPYALSFTF